MVEHCQEWEEGTHHSAVELSSFANYQPRSVSGHFGKDELCENLRDWLSAP
jgi:hypothetical protein